ncbi:folylpolyglutamate synthase/dihydrofolate synthase family protein [Corynebacterium marquesiae]|uniref:bifunctional tetrahydrofolate synthase/dihydrofolate synthase n=1 Tax=Corynebacterium TaxID=1716 RepID=UPI000AEF1402|nr:MULTISPECIES: folylpolyglutamate synthase/dihydrofolate synthase family protein [Corynebacterium]MCG7448024.1 bifunctional folylpolyglutamate synthase/dihydrofolate synthase [Corynebacterium aurimucosum]MDK8454512.1 folylpolyglutamate synthase/dihydrofolate synthase family protein [Corynebacterium marquesiae]MDK8480176.1 folylpolyglutamate synthase/dihydrofolate synthase family protein [Corynebacterium marquesiae]MDK8668634.1 folylpolyglutamate synthase/dihydrofolate synthase family protein 
MADKDKETEDFEIVDALKEGTDGGPVEITESGLTLNLGMGSEDEYNEAAPQEVSAEELRALAEVEEELNERWPETKIEPSLDRIEMLMDLLGHPERSFDVIHIAGTNGKSSTARMVDSLLRAFHRRVGLVTSPHLQRVTERIGIDGQPIHPRDYVRIWHEIKPFVEMVDAQSDVPMSKFEVLVGLSYAAFADAPVDVAVVEVGLGGRWDATNVVNADVSVITPVGLDHTDYLGDTLAEIAGEKAGIIKPREDADDPLTPNENIVVIAEQDPEAMRVILQQAVDVEAGVARSGSEFAALESRIAVGGQQVNIQGLGGLYEDIFLPLHGEHQAKNAAVALAAVEAFFGASAGHPLDVATVRNGFAQAISPGRLERVRTSPTTFIDAAHNPHGAKALGAALDRDFDFARLIGVLSIFADKDATGILTALEPYLTEVVITQNSSPRALDAYDLAETARDIFGEERVHVADNLPGAYAQAVELAEDAEVQSGSGIIITGSVVTAGDARAMFGKEPA